MATQCIKCGNVVPDIGGHLCGVWGNFASTRPRVYTKKGCSQCGSTAIDHTEAECLRNRQLKPLTPPPPII